MVVYDIQQYGKAVRMAGVDESDEILRRPVSRKRREQIHTVIAPAASTRKCRQGHQFEMRHAKFNQVRQLPSRRCVCTLGGECSDVKFVNDGLIQRLGAERGAVARPWISLNASSKVRSS